MTSGSRHRAALRLVEEPAEQPAAEPASHGGLGALELLPGRVRAALLDRTGRVLRRTQVSYPTGTPDTAQIDAALRAVATECFGPDQPVAIGVAAAGLVDAEAGVILQAHEVPALRGYPIAEVLRTVSPVPVHIEHRARLQVLGDRWFGAGRGRSTFASVSTGEVLGVGILYDGQVLAPPGGRSGAHMTVAASGARCTCGARGCWKTVATTPWLRARAATAGFGERASVASLAASADPAAGVVLAEYADNLALGLLNIQQLFAPGLFVLHGEARLGGDRFRELIEHRLHEDSSWRHGAEQPTVSVADTDVDDIALLGAAGLVLSRL
ncbi:glucokinase [Tamaricihabitans halophyticus]|uniref:Glucokinase n=1 Tax=Tamaricihabitans halophyticus TaxID=1262583 RepID=A0A4R2QEF9_9PSEU|nr:ROK family protein [Tamaricihabitans halophyticus]TCP45431.1 glucokinase [Tamaricihabitans halophyticus]